jgi:hypothetical protein
MSYKHVSAGSALAALLTITGPQLLGQSTSPAGSVDSTEDETVVLSPFVIESSEDADSYRATNTLAGTRIRTELKDVGSAISVVTQKFLQDTNSRKADDLLVYTTGTEVAGQGGNFLGQGDGAVLTDTNRRSPNANTRVRGLDEADNTRDFFLSDIPWDSYNVGRVDLQRGPNAILFGIGSPAGIINASLNSAAFKDSNKVELQFGSYDSTRATADFNKVLLANELAVRVSLLRDDTNYRQEPAYKDDERVYGAVKWDPKAFQHNGMRTSIRFNYEKGHIDSNLPRNSPPLDAITPWYTVLGKRTFDARTSTDVVNSLDAPERHWYGAPGNRVYDGVVTAYNGSTPGISYQTQVNPYPDATATVPSTVVGNNTFRGIRTYDSYGNAAFPAGVIGAYRAKSLTDRSIFDFYDNLLEGDNKHEFNDFRAYNLSVSQTFLDGKVGFEFAHDNQNANWGYSNFLSGDAAAITVDVMDTLVNGQANPNVGRVMTIAGGGGAGMFWQDREREVNRLTGYYDMDFKDLMGRESTLGKILGRNVFTGLWSRQENNSQFRSGPRHFLSPDYVAVKRSSDGVVDQLSQASRNDIFYMYLGGDVSGRNSASGINASRVNGIIQPVTGSTINVYNNTTAAWTDVPLLVHNNDILPRGSRTYADAELTESIVDSKALVWQGYLFDGHIVPMYGWREDEEEFKRGAAAKVGGVAQTNDPMWKLPEDGDVIGGQTQTWSVVAHAPRSLMDKLPGGLGLSVFYNESENFRPDAGRRDILGNPVASPAGSTKDYGITLSAFDEKLILKVNRYKSQMTNANIRGSLGGGQYLIGAVEAWGQQAASKFREAAAGGTATWPASEVYGTASDGTVVTWRPAGALQGTSGNWQYSQAEIDATAARMNASINAWYATQAPAAFQQFWGMSNYAAGGGSWSEPSALAVTGDTASEGWEYELIANPIRGLNVSVNAAKTSARRFNLAQSYVDWINKRWADFQGPAGEMRLWGGDDDSSTFYGGDAAHGGETARAKYGRETMASFNLWKALEQSDVPELRPWRFNVVANYDFQSDRLRGFNVGGSYRWQDKSVTGFPVIANPDGSYRYDVDRPYKGESEDVTDLWVGYQRKLTDRIHWRIQINVRNVFYDDGLVPVTVQPDGSPAAYRIPEPRTWYVTNTFTF